MLMDLWPYVEALPDEQRGDFASSKEVETS